MSPYQRSATIVFVLLTKHISSATLMIRAPEQMASFPFSCSDSDDDLESDEEDDEDEDNDEDYDDEIDETAEKRYLA